MEGQGRKTKRKKTRRILLEDSDSDNDFTDDFTPVVKKVKKVVTESQSEHIQISNMKTRLSRDDKMFERNVQSALTASLKSPSEVTVISNPMALSDIEEDSKENSIDIPPADLCSREDRGSTVTLDVERHEQLVDDFVTTKQLEIKITKSLSAKQHWKPPTVITSRDKKNGMVFSSSSVSKSSPTIRVGLSRHAKVKSLHIPVKHSLKEK